MAAQSKYFCAVRTCPSAAEIRLLILNGGQRQRKRNRPRRREREKDQEEEASNMEDAMASRPEPERGVGAEDSPSYPERHRSQTSTVDADLLQTEADELTHQPRRMQPSTEAGWKKTIIGSLVRRLSAASLGPEQGRRTGAPKLESKALPESEVLQAEMTTSQHKAPQPAFQTPAETEQTGTGGTASEAGRKNDPALMIDTTPVTASATATDSVPVTELAAALPAALIKTTSEPTSPSTTTTECIISTTEFTTKIDIRTQIIPERPISDIDTASDEKLNADLPRPGSVHYQLMPYNLLQE